MTNAPVEQVRLSRDDWLRRGLAVLAAESSSQLSIERICLELGVTKGSFYWHFDNQLDFYRAVIDYWDQHHTRQVMDRTAALPPRERLNGIYEIVLGEDLPRYNEVIARIARGSPELGERVDQVNESHRQFVGAAFEELGFSGPDLETRIHAFVSFAYVENRIAAAEDVEIRLDRARRLIDLITAPAS